ncbi:hypothetical protein ACH5RR_022684 [Cinchona calisaya]|uniref:ADP-ribosyl cyclase/cyclic ADP-ribose hydrolase n=1 Tax=Cinchona calisaya TaxID=153742 RepID=A0ABD2ZBN7_9GENT
MDILLSSPTKVYYCMVGHCSSLQFRLMEMAKWRPGEPSSSTSSCYYDVFLSFRGDTRKTFTDHLYTALNHAGFHTFRDEEEVEKGENITSELQKAIKQSKSAIIVFSDDYASSRWCLDELLLIMECKRTSGQIVLPLFYDVDPSQVRKQTGSFEKAFWMHEKRYKNDRNADVDKVKRWREVLKEAADLGGMVLKNEADGQESKFIQKVVKVIEDKLHRTVSSIAPYLVGLYSRVRDINQWIQDGSSKVGMVAISGMGGIGKTTIAKFVYNLNLRRFEASSFLSDIRETSKESKGLLRLQTKLLSDILKRKELKILSVDEGTVKVQVALCSKRTLVVLDDVDREGQITAILGMQSWFHPGSKIIITTRHEHLLNGQQLHKVYNVEKLDTDESFKLFSWYAFGKEIIPESFTQLSRGVINYCGGLPLALRVLGSSLSGKTAEVWESALKKLSAIPESRILEKLKISYDSLQDDHDKNLFLHIACFFAGKNQELTVAILDECGCYTKVGIENLIDRCILTVNEQNKLCMHQLLRDMGREIVRQESPKNPGRRSRLWHHRDSYSVLKDKSGTETVEGLVLDMRTFQDACSVHATIRIDDETTRSQLAVLPSISSENLINLSQDSVNNKLNLEIDAFAKMNKLRILQLSYVQLTTNYEELPCTITWLSWQGFPSSSIPNSFPLENLVALDMRYSSLVQFWKGNKFLRLLKILNLSHSHGLVETPDFTLLPNLETLILKDCGSLPELSESIGYLQRLLLLNLKDCKSLKKLPRNIKLLKFLETLNISGCSSINVPPEDLSKMKSLKVLIADGIALSQILSTTREVETWHSYFNSWVSKPKHSPEMSWISLPGTLVNLSLANCRLSDDDFPIDFSNLSSLQRVNLSGNLIRRLPVCIRGLTGLLSLRLESCKELQSLEELPGVKKLNVSYCPALQKITYQSTTVKPEQTAFADCYNLVEVEDWFKLEPLESIDYEITNTLGLYNFGTMQNTEVILVFGVLGVLYTKICPIQGFQEHGIYNIFLPGQEVPSWFSHKNNGSSISFTVPSLPNLKIRGLNICSVYSHLDNEDYWCGNIFCDEKALLPHPLFTKISNKSKCLEWIYGPSCFGIPEDAEYMIWLSHWKFGNHLEAGDEVCVSIIADSGFQVKECGFNIVFEQEENIARPSDLCSTDMDLSAFHEVNEGVFFMCDPALSAVYDSSSAAWSEYLFGDSDESLGKILVSFFLLYNILTKEKITSLRDFDFLLSCLACPTYSEEEMNLEPAEQGEDKDRRCWIGFKVSKAIAIAAMLFLSLAFVSRKSLSMWKKQRPKKLT